MADNNQGLETLAVWQKSVDFAVDVCQYLLPMLPDVEKWALNSQLRRSVQSIPANIAEGYGRYNFQEAIHYCYIARGSMSETKTHLLIAHRLGNIDTLMHDEYKSRLVALGKMINGYIGHLRKQKNISFIREVEDDSYREDLGLY